MVTDADDADVDEVEGALYDGLGHLEAALAKLGVAEAFALGPAQASLNEMLQDLSILVDAARDLHDQLRPQNTHPRIVCLCGSTRFYEAFRRANYEETMAGRIVLTVGFARPSPESESERVRYEHHGEEIGCTPEQKVALDWLHKKKIDLADEVLVLNVGGYIGESTRSEISYARQTGKPIRWLQAPIGEAG